MKKAPMGFVSAGGASLQIGSLAERFLEGPGWVSEEEVFAQNPKP